MSATVTQDIAETMYEAYRSGWREFAGMETCSDHVNILCSGNASNSCQTNLNGENFSTVYRNSLGATLAMLSTNSTPRKSRILPEVNSWDELIAQMNLSCSEMHDHHHSVINGFEVSFGLINANRIFHKAKIAVDLPAGNIVVDGVSRLRLKICLHSNFPRIYRSWIESKIKQALTRKGEHPDAGLQAVLEEMDVFKRAAQAGIQKIEIVLIASPVIETGNDIDFDYAILDPLSIRSIVQVSGRVVRHRDRVINRENILLLHRSMIAMETGKLAFPGVETRPARSTLLTGVDLEQFPKRIFHELLGDVDLTRVTAAAILDDAHMCPLRDAETSLRKDMFDLSDKSSLSAYLINPVSRLNRKIMETRMFRRSIKSSIKYTLVGDNVLNSTWMGNPSPYYRNSEFRSLSSSEFRIVSYPLEEILFQNIRDMAINDYSIKNGFLDSARLQSLFEIDVNVYDHERSELFPVVEYSDFTGLIKKK